MTKHKFKVGDTVIMNKESEYYNDGTVQLNDNIGTICEITDSVIDSHHYKVKWDYKGVTECNCYSDWDLLRTRS
jgi:hypothetical protein